MPSIREVIFRAGLARPDAYMEESKAHWLMELDGKLMREVILQHKLSPGHEKTGPAGVCAKCGESDKLSYNKHLDMTRCECGWDSGPETARCYPDDMDKELLVKTPYDNLYDLYIAAQVDYYNRENDNYNDSVTLFKQAEKEWRRKYHQTHLPVSPMDQTDWEVV